MSGAVVATRPRLRFRIAHRDVGTRILRHACGEPELPPARAFDHATVSTIEAHEARREPHEWLAFDPAHVDRGRRDDRPTRVALEIEQRDLVITRHEHARRTELDRDRVPPCSARNANSPPDRVRRS
jgi:hypothetical protein